MDFAHVFGPFSALDKLQEADAGKHQPLNSRRGKIAGEEFTMSAGAAGGVLISRL